MCDTMKHNKYSRAKLLLSGKLTVLKGERLTPSSCSAHVLSIEKCSDQGTLTVALFVESHDHVLS